MIKIQNSLLFHKFLLKLQNSDVTKEALNCTAFITADSIADDISLIMHIVLRVNANTSSLQSPNPTGFEFLNVVRSGFGWSQIQHNPKRHCHKRQLTSSVTEKSAGTIVRGNEAFQDTFFFTNKAMQTMQNIHIY